MKKITKIGWVGKAQSKNDIIKIGDFGRIEVYVWAKKEKKANWIDSNWPPIKVRITVEEVK